MLSPEEIRDLNESYRQDFNRHDANSLRQYYADHVNWTNPGSLQPISDADEIPQQYAPLFVSFPDIKLQFVDDFSEGYHNAHHWIMRGTNDGPIEVGGQIFKATRKCIVLKGLSMLILNAEGKIVADHTYYDPSSINKQLGVG